MNNEPVNIVTKSSPLDAKLRSEANKFSESPDRTPKAKKMKRNISSKGKKRNVDIESAKSAKVKSGSKIAESLEKSIQSVELVKENSKEPEE